MLATTSPYEIFVGLYSKSLYRVSQFPYKHLISIVSNSPIASSTWNETTPALVVIYAFSINKFAAQLFVAGFGYMHP